MKVYFKTVSIKCIWNYEFDLTTLGFNDQNSPVPSRSLNRVPTVHNLLIRKSLVDRCCEGWPFVHGNQPWAPKHLWNWLNPKLNWPKLSKSSALPFGRFPSVNFTIVLLLNAFLTILLHRAIELVSTTTFVIWLSRGWRTPTIPRVNYSITKDLISAIVWRWAQSGWKGVGRGCWSGDW